MDTYQQALDRDTKGSFNQPEQAFEQMARGYEPHYMKLVQSDGQMLGLAFFNIDHSYQAEFRAYIRHLSVTDKTRWSDAI